MKLQDMLDEMTLRSPGMGEQQYARELEQLVDNAEQFDHVGDMESIQVLHKDNIYVFRDSDHNSFIGFAEVFAEQNDALLNNIYLIPECRGQDIFAKFIWFLKRNEQYPRIILGDVHSENTTKAIKRVRKRFDIYWQRDSQKERFDPNTVDKYYGEMRKTGWRVVLENDGDFSDWPRYSSGVGDTIKKSYEAFLDPLEE